MYLNYIFSGLLLVALSLGQCVQAQNRAVADDEHRSALSKNVEVFTSIVKELELFYVDSIQPKKMIEDGIRGMLSKLDPYTDYIPEENQDDFTFMTTGEYGGIGSIISTRAGKTSIVQPYEGMPADVAGLKAGDVLLEIDGIKLEKIENPSEKLKGIPNTKLTILYQRPGSDKPQKVEIVRKRIQLSPIPYYGVLENKTGYILLNNFTVNCAQEVRAALLDLKSKYSIESLILDLRNNPGGIMEEAVQVANLFIPKGKVIVSTKGKIKQQERVYRTPLDAVDTAIPLVVLVNANSASASEIVAGAIQDLDRGVVVGERTFGKGLVQTSRTLPFDGLLKLTTAKYYIPSGRCIQAIDYSHRRIDGSARAIPDSLTSVFYTAAGRSVRDGGGVSPDIAVETSPKGNIAYYLVAENLIFDYVTTWVQQHSEIAKAEDFVFPDSDFEAFKDFVKAGKFTYDRQSEGALASLKKIMDFEGYTEVAAAELEALEKKLHPDLDRDLELNKDDIVELIAIEIMKRYYYEKGEVIEALKRDAEVSKAIEVLHSSSLYQSVLAAPEPSEASAATP